jgi:hypothetical protein
MSNATDATKKRPKETVKQKLVDALRKTGHVSEGALEAVADVVVKVTFGFAEE